KLIDFFDLQYPKKSPASNPRILNKAISSFTSLTDMLTELHPIKEYESELEKIIQHPADNRGIYFNKLRAEFPLRQEFAQTYLPASYFEQYPVLEKLGFSISES
ncbi:MAG TPA: hypothetical protein VJ964_09810, partial [Balneolaceae bacterium]|nr:hypothetical protein [Balneolaceae bacterium]